MSMQDIDWNEYWPPIRLSLQVALLSSVLVIILGLLVAWSMSRLGLFKGKTVVETVLMLPLVLPPTVVGFYCSYYLDEKAGSDGLWSNGLASLLYSRGGLGL